jgi:hypothetical protein
MYCPILPLVCVAILLFGLKDIERDEAIILFVGIFGFLTMLLMYTLRWAVMVSDKHTP